MEIVLARFKNRGRICTFDAVDIKCKKGDICIVECKEELSNIQVIVPNMQYKKNLKEFTKILRKASEEDLIQIDKIIETEEIAYDFCMKKIEERDLPMKLVCVDFNFDMTKARFSFTADGRIDFRQLVKDLAYEFRVRIEMKQIGVRDEARIWGELGFCGKELCCKTFLLDFEPVSMRMAKEQNLPLNPSKISGVCGRLLCCLNFENRNYEEIKKELPKIGQKIKVPTGEGTVIDIDVLKERIKVLLSNNSRIILTKPDYIKLNAKKKDESQN
ncbi:stage 0 sporulation protein [bacterium]|nr:stage 0 sporulation protein [bacterium]